MQANVTIRSVVTAGNPAGDNYIIIDGVDHIIPITTGVAVSVIRQLRLTRDEKPIVKVLSKIYNYK